jgi:hypothetical protein
VQQAHCLYRRHERLLFNEVKAQSKVRETLTRASHFQALQSAGAATARERAAALVWENEARRYGEVIAYMEACEQQLQADLRRSVPLEEHQRAVDELKRLKREAEGVRRERAEVDRELTSQIKVGWWADVAD